MMERMRKVNDVVLIDSNSTSPGTIHGLTDIGNTTYWNRSSATTDLATTPSWISEDITNDIANTQDDTIDFNIKPILTSASDIVNRTLSNIFEYGATEMTPSEVSASLVTCCNLIPNASEIDCVCANSTEGFPRPEIHFKTPLLGVFLGFFAIVTIVGNILVVIAVARERYLRTVTNYFIVSLATADLAMGSVVMPFGIILEQMNDVWIFGRDWCDIWHSFDVLGSTASILNLCVISLDRYWAITDPIAYPRKMSIGRACVTIAVVWVCSCGISFPAILWWRHVEPTNSSPYKCTFTGDSAYLIFSSLVSFYIPLFVMCFVYWRIYRVATIQLRGLQSGQKQMHMSTEGVDGEVIALRMHRGGRKTILSQNGNGYGHSGHGCSPSSISTHGMNGHSIYERANSDSDTESPAHLIQRSEEDLRSSGHAVNNKISRKFKTFAISKKVTKLARERKAAKTLGIVMGIFIICWLPFFIFNAMFALCKLDCVKHPEIIFPIVTWLGYINSGMNPIIYACSMRDFRRAFLKILFACCPKYRNIYRRRRQQLSAEYSRTEYSFTNNCNLNGSGERCDIHL
ncbi:unnamed protein product [Owenia fusiformis]|uniref:Uncharacterized protein n=1 Tax=Owenia fusiformis TaxID=6347 RepID=A0A8J1XH73_OWEFU|nr:unnamed protein product [Owenia fusiformis]